MELQKLHVYIVLGVLVVLLQVSLFSNPWFTASDKGATYSWGLYNSCITIKGSENCSSVSLPTGKLIVADICRIFLILSIVAIITLYFWMFYFPINMKIYRIFFISLISAQFLTLLLALIWLKDNNTFQKDTLKGSPGYAFYSCLVSLLLTGGIFAMIEKYWK